jgi:hypothetical protein
VQEGSAVLSVEQLERLHHSDRPPPDLYAHLVPDGLTSAAEYSKVRVLLFALSVACLL